jgi:nitrite reductase/ring-hydroxylating ferredoxin subunit/uncharacterized membrane protein
VGKALGSAFGRLVRPGRLKDLLSGAWMAHPAHPMLTDVPIGAWTSAFILDLVPAEDARASADRLVGLGVLAAIPTAVTGLSELSDVMNREERSVGAAHALGNVAAVAFYAASFLLRRRGRRGWGVTLSTVGAGIVTAAGFLGGHLSYRLGVGVDQTIFEKRPEDWMPVLDDAALPEGKPMRVTVDGSEVLLYRADRRIYALGNRCSHRGGPLHKGQFQDRLVTCPWHLSTFRLEDGSVVRGPAPAPQPAFDARVNQGKIEVRVRG